MNHLAHLFLAPDSALHRIGALMGDFARGVDVSALSVPVREGLEHHRAVDVFTDSHPEVIASKKLFSAQRRRFAGVALDVLYDHYLLQNWSEFSHIPQDEFIDLVYREMQQHNHAMSAEQQIVTGRIVRYDWFRSYRDLSNVGFALDRVAQRIRFRNRFDGIIDEIRIHDEELEERFLRFFPDLQQYAKSFSK